MLRKKREFSKGSRNVLLTSCCCDLCPPCNRQFLHCTTSFHRKAAPVDLFQSLLVSYITHLTGFCCWGSLLLVSHSLGWTCITIVQAWYLCRIYLTYGRLMHLFSARQWECASLPYCSFSLSWVLSLYFFPTAGVSKKNSTDPWHE